MGLQLEVGIWKENHWKREYDIYTDKFIRTYKVSYIDRYIDR